MRGLRSNLGYYHRRCRRFDFAAFRIGRPTRICAARQVLAGVLKHEKLLTVTKTSDKMLDNKSLPIHLKGRADAVILPRSLTILRD